MVNEARPQDRNGECMKYIKEVIDVALPKEINKQGLYHFRQNNSGGSFDVDESVTVNVYIEAQSTTQANDFAEAVGIYFDGVSTGQDCPCCGDRWEMISSYESPEYNTVEELEADFNFSGGWVSSDYWLKGGEPFVIVYLMDGSKIIYRSKKKQGER